MNITLALPLITRSAPYGLFARSMQGFVNVIEVPIIPAVLPQ